MQRKRMKVVADSHLGIRQGDVEQMMRFVDSLDPTTEELVFLGDLFHIWAGPKSYHTDAVQSFLKRLEAFCASGGRVHLIVGNRDVFFPEINEVKQKEHLPFTTISKEFAFFESEGLKLGLTHGDTVNQKDTQYLKWRRTVRSRWFRGMFGLMPSPVVKKIMFSLEEKLKNTNMEFRRDFPNKEWMRFLKASVDEWGLKLLVVGHFHPETQIVTPFRDATGIVLPDWFSSQHYLIIDRDLNFDFERFEA